MELPPRVVCMFAAAAGIVGLTAGAAIAAHVQHSPQINKDKNKARQKSCRECEEPNGTGCNVSPQREGPRGGEEVADRQVAKGIVITDADNDEDAESLSSSGRAVQLPLTHPGSWRHRAEELCRDLARVRREGESSQKQFMADKAMLNQRLDDMLQTLAREQKVKKALRQQNEVISYKHTLTHLRTHTRSGGRVSRRRIYLRICHPDSHKLSTFSLSWSTQLLTKRPRWRTRHKFPRSRVRMMPELRCSEKYKKRRKR